MISLVVTSLIACGCSAVGASVTPGLVITIFGFTIIILKK